MEEIENKLKKIFNTNIELSQEYKSVIRNTLLEMKINKIEKKNNFKKKLIVGLSTSAIVLSSATCMANIDNINKVFGLGSNIEKATNSGYIVETDSNYIESNSSINKNSENILNNTSIKTKIDDFFIDNHNISSHFSILLDNSMLKTENLTTINNVIFEDLKVTDEDDSILYSTDENNKNYNCGINSFVESFSKKNGEIKLTYNIYSQEEFPKSKKLYFEYSKIKFEDNNNNYYILNGNWKIELNVSEEMYNRNSNDYKVISCDNKDFEIYTAKVSETGFELGITINNIEKISDESYIFQKNIEVVNDETILNKKDDDTTTYITETEYENWIDSLNPIRTLDYINKENPKDNVSYVENENGERFYCSDSVSRKQNKNFISENKYDFYETFEMIKQDATNNIKVILYYYGTPVTIELEKE